MGKVEVTLTSSTDNVVDEQFHPKPQARAIKRSKCNNASHCLPAFCRVKVPNHVASKDRWDTSSAASIKRRPRPCPRNASSTWDEMVLQKSMSQCEINCLVKVGFNWNDQSNFQMTNVQFARLRFIGSLGWQKSQTEADMQCDVDPRFTTPPTLLHWGRPILAPIYHFYGTSPEVNRHGLWIKGWHWRFRTAFKTPMTCYFTD